MIARTVPAAVRVPYFIASTDPENFYYSLLVQYMPYRSEAELLQGFYSAREAFLAREEQLKAISGHMERHRERGRQLEIAFNQMHAFQILEEPLVLDNIEHNEDYPEQTMTNYQVNSARQAMNMDQGQLFNTITSNIQSQQQGDQQRFKLFVTGGTGTGKTFLFNLLKNQVNRCYGKQVTKIGALTGVAARLVGGSTLHSLLQLPVQRDGVLVNMPQLSGNFLRIMRQQWQNVKFLFVDEISMVPYEMLCMIDARLRQLKNYGEPFGGINVMLFGDLLQLPPVRGKQVFQQPDHMRPATHLWRLFTLVKLRQNMHQRGDTTFIDILNALRVGQLNSEHLAVLLTKVSSNATGEFALEKALRIYPTNNQVEKHNNEVLKLYEQKGTQMYDKKAQDRLIDAIRNLGNTTIESNILSDINKTGGLPSKLNIFKGAKIMLRSNIDVEKGLVNGSIGFISDIVWPHLRCDQIYETDIASIKVNFGNDGEHLIQPIGIQFPAKYSYGTVEMRMLPVILSWASTVHKMQGCMVDDAVVYLGSRTFAAGQAYVALSRVKSLSGLQIEELDCSKLTYKTPCNTDALAEMERMRVHFAYLK